MNAANKLNIINTITGVLLLAALPSANATEATTDAFARNPACGSLGYTQMQDMKLAQKAQEGVESFVQYVRLTRTIQQWSIEEALKRAQSAAITSCGVAMGFKPIDNTKFATALAANSR